MFSSKYRCLQVTLDISKWILVSKIDWWLTDDFRLVSSIAIASFILPMLIEVLKQEHSISLMNLEQFSMYFQVKLSKWLEKYNSSIILTHRKYSRIAENLSLSKVTIFRKYWSTKNIIWPKLLAHLWWAIKDIDLPKILVHWNNWPTEKLSARKFRVLITLKR